MNIHMNELHGVGICDTYMPYFTIELFFKPLLFSLGQHTYNQMCELIGQLENSNVIFFLAS